VIPPQLSNICGDNCRSEKQVLAARRMDTTQDKNWASKQLLDPLTGPDPAFEDGPGGSHFGNTFAAASIEKSGQASASDKDLIKTAVRPVKTAYPTPPGSASPSRSAFPEYRGAGIDSTERSLKSPRQSDEFASSVRQAKSSRSDEIVTQRRRGSSLTARFPGDTSHKPLDILRAETRAADRHARRSSRVGTDMIDQLDAVGGSPLYHHDGPYDATLLGRNIMPEYSPVAATASTNREALRATPREFIADAVQGHRPLQGTSVVPPGQADRYGRVLQYKEGPNLNIEMGWRRWEGIDYHPDDIKGKGEPYFTIDRAIKNDAKKSSHRRVFSDGGIELSERPRSSSTSHTPPRASHLRSASGIDDQTGSAQAEQSYAEWADSGLRRAHTTGRRGVTPGGLFKSKFGSLRRRKPVERNVIESEVEDHDDA